MVRFLSDDYQGKLDMRSHDTLDALTQLARALAVVPGRKNLIWISGGFPFDSLSNGDRLQRVSALLAATRIAVYPVDVRGVLSMQPDGQTRDSEIFAKPGVREYRLASTRKTERWWKRCKTSRRSPAAMHISHERSGPCDRRCNGDRVELLHAGLPAVEQ